MADEPVQDGGPPSTAVESAAASSPIAIVGIGVGSRSLASLEPLFARMGQVREAAIVVVLRQRDGIDPAGVTETIQVHSDLPATVVSDDLTPEAGHVYVAPAGRLLKFANGLLSLEEAGERAGQRGTVDSFLISLAEAKGAGAIGVILSDVGPDGVAGITGIKEHGGLTLCEAEEGAGSEFRPQIDPAGLADFVLPVEQIPDRLYHYITHLQQHSAAAVATQVADEPVVPDITRITAILRNRTGHDFHGYKRNTFMRRVQRRMQVRQINTLERYIEFLRGDADEVGHLFQDLLIGVTQFFRDQPEFDLLEREVIPKLLQGKGADDVVRIWVLGCATGEEAYFIAILLREHIATLDAAPRLQIFATDIDGRALSMARAGRYPETIAKDLTPERLNRWFTKEGSTYCVGKELREICLFSQHNVIKDAPFSRIDLVSCRNLLIYLTSDLQERVIPLFHFALRPDGFLFLGPSENVTRHAKLFSPIDRKLRIFRRLETAVRVLPEFPPTAGNSTKPDAERPVPTARRGAGATVSRQAERIAERYAPAYTVIDEQFDVLSFSGRTGKFLEPASGTASLNILNLVHRDLRVDLRAALHQAATSRQAAKAERLTLGDNGARRRVDIVVEPVAEDGSLTNYVVLFRDGGPAPDAGAEWEPDATAARDLHVQRLENELRQTKDRLQATIEELESTNEELKSSNEEYQSINEELQSANEELETSKEELQSVNEELQTVNGELAHRVNDLARANSDLKNLLESTQIATVFLDNDLRVKGFTPSMSEIFHLIDSDLGRPITHINARIGYPDLQDDVRRVLRTLSTIEREVGTDGSRYLVRVLPYRNIDNFIAGVVLTFLDITPTFKAQGELRAAEERARLANAAARMVTWDMKISSEVLTYSENFQEIFGSPPAANLRGLMVQVHPDDRDRLQDAFRRAVGDAGVMDIQVRLQAADTEIWVRLQARRSGDQLFGVTQDITDRRMAEAQQSLLLAELQHRVKNILAVVRSITSGTLETSGTLDEFSSHFMGRINALARTQSVLTRRGPDGIELEDLVRDELAATHVVETEQIEISGPPILLKDKAAEAFALALHELTTNAVKYGAFATSDGRVSVIWRLVNTSSGRKLSLEWRESGVAALDARPRRVGFGRELIERGLPYDLGAVTGLEFAPGGVRCTIELPLGQRIVALDPNDRPR